MSEYLKFFSLGSLWILLFAYFMRNGSTHLMAAFNWLRGKVMSYAQELYAMHCEVSRLRKLQQFRKRFHRMWGPRFRSVRNITFLMLLMLVAIPAFATDRCIRAAGDNSAAGTCTAWGSTACTNVSSISSLARGETVYVATGSYSIWTLSLANSGTTVITIKPATVADHGTCTGWSDVFAGQPVVDGVDYHSGYWTIDGGTRNELDWSSASAYGFKFTNATNVFYANYPNNSTCPDHEIIQYVDFGGADIGNVYAVNPSGINALGLDGTDTCDNWSVNHNRIHNTNLAISIKSAKNFTIEYNLIINAWSKEAIRGSTISSGHIIRYNIMQDACQFTPGDGTSTCTGEIAIWGDSFANSYDDIKIYGNVVRVTTSEQHTGGVIILGGDGSSWSGIAANNAEVYNNTTVGIQSSQAGILINGGTGNICKNNLWYDTVGTPACTGAGLTQSNNSEVDSDPFVNYSTGNLHLSANTTTGATLSSPYNQDMDGVTRGVPAAWSLGAFQFVGSGGPVFNGRPMMFFFVLLLLLLIHLPFHRPKSADPIHEPERQSVPWR